MPTIEWFESVRRLDADGAEPDVVEIAHCDGTVIHTRSWYDGELIDWHPGPPRSSPDAPTVVDLWWDSIDAERHYWSDPYLQPLQVARVRQGDVEGEFDTSATFLERFAPAEELPDASFSLLIEMSGLALHPSATHTWALQLHHGRPVNPAGSVDEPDLHVHGSVDLIVAWLTGERLLSGMMSELDVEGEILMLGAVAGAMGISGGFRVPTELAATAYALVSLVQDHRALLDDSTGVQFG